MGEAKRGGRTVILYVRLLNHTPNPEKTVAMAARMCYSAVGPDLIEEELLPDRVAALIRRLRKNGHLSPFEHASFTFAVSGSRALSHQMVRHRIASYSQKSQRYIQETGFRFVTPELVQRNPAAHELFQRCMKQIEQTYNEMLALGIHREDARYVLPNACETSFLCTFNARSLHNFFRLRQCRRAQWEIRRVANLMLREAKKVAPVLFEGAGPSCIAEGVCYEGEMSCGLVKRLKKGQTGKIYRPVASGG